MFSYNFTVSSPSRSTVALTLLLTLVIKPDSSILMSSVTASSTTAFNSNSRHNGGAHWNWNVVNNNVEYLLIFILGSVLVLKVEKIELPACSNPSSPHCPSPFSPLLHWRIQTPKLDGHPTPPFSFPALPFPACSFTLPSHFLLEVGALKYSQRVWKCAVNSLPQNPQRKSNFVHFSRKIWHLVAPILLIFLRVHALDISFTTWMPPGCRPWPPTYNFSTGRLCFHCILVADLVLNEMLFMVIVVKEHYRTVLNSIFVVFL